MKKAPAPTKTQGASESEQAKFIPRSQFLGTDNPRHLRALQALSVRPVPREHLDRVAGCSNGPDLVAELRRRGLEVPCSRTRTLDRDLFPCWPGVYSLSPQDRRKLTAWKRRRAAAQVARNGGH